MVGSVRFRNLLAVPSFPSDSTEIDSVYLPDKNGVSCDQELVGIYYFQTSNISEIEIKKGKSPFGADFTIFSHRICRQPFLF